jgi:hypothetical protein
MAKFLVRQRRPMWVCLVQEVEAETMEEAEDTFYNEFNPQHSVIEGAVQRVEAGPVSVWIAEDFPNVLDVVNHD